MERSKGNHRLMEVDFSYMTRELSGKVSAPVAAKFYIEWSSNNPKFPMSIIIEYRYATVISTCSTAGIGLPVTTLWILYVLLLSLYQRNELTSKFCLFYFSRLDCDPNRARAKASLGTSELCNFFSYRRQHDGLFWRERLFYYSEMGISSISVDLLLMFTSFRLSQFASSCKF